MKSSSAARKVNTSSRKKLKEFEWTDEEILAISNGHTKNTKIEQSATSNGTDSSMFVDTMENKIARVQARQKESRERAIRVSKRSQPSNKNTISQFLASIPKKDLVDVLKEGELSFIAYGMNAYFHNILQEQPHFLEEVESLIPLYKFDSSEFSEINSLPTNYPYEALYLKTSNHNWDSMEERCLGKWVPCTAHSKSGEYVSISVLGSEILVHEMLIYTKSQSINIYEDRIVAALTRRSTCISLIHYHFDIQSMPFNECIVSSMTSQQIDNIHRRAISMARLTEVPVIVSSMEMDNVIKDYEIVMNSILYNSYLVSKLGYPELAKRHIPSQVLGLARPKVPYYAVYEVPNYNIKARIHQLQSQSLLGAVAALKSLQGSVSENLAIQKCEIISCIYPKTMTIEKFERSFDEQLIYAVRFLKQDWPSRVSSAIRNSMNSYQQKATIRASSPTKKNALIPSKASTLQPPPSVEQEVVVYDLNIRNVHDYDKPDVSIRLFLERINFMMTDMLTSVIKSNLLSFTSTVKDLCSSEILVKDIRNIIVNMPDNSIYKRKVLPPLFSIAFRVQNDLQVINQQEIKDRDFEIMQWNKANEMATDPCPLQRIAPIMGRKFEYSVELSHFKKVILDAFDSMITEFSDIGHIRKSVMEKIYYPVARSIGTVTSDLEYVQTSRKEIELAMDTAIMPLKTYLSLFEKYETFININNEDYLQSRIRVVRVNHDNHASSSHTSLNDAPSFISAPTYELELPVNVNLSEVCQVINEHQNQIQEIEDSLPINPIYCGLFLVEVVSVRNLLLEKHRGIIKLILVSHSKYCMELATYLEEQFQRISSNLNKRPETIEQLVELETYMASLPATLSTLQGFINDMMGYYNILDQYKFKLDYNNSIGDAYNRKWIIFGQPSRIQQLCSDIAVANATIRRRLLDDMHDEQSDFIREMNELEESVKGLEAFKELYNVTAIAEKVKQVEEKLKLTTDKSKLFNSREGLFMQDITEYEKISVITKAFEPYSQLWLSAKSWLESSAKWTKGSFVDINAEELEHSVDNYFTSISKALKYFQKNNFEAQMNIATTIRTQIVAFQPQVPLIVLLRNPGMRERHWNKIANDLKVSLLPIEKFTTQEVLAFGLSQYIDEIAKISESAAKEYQIEQAMAKMASEWENITLQISPYKDTGTGVLKGVDDIMAVLDDQVTKTQMMMFSSFKGPFEAQIEDWNRKLNMISDVLEAWVGVQRNWLYLQPIFESPDINRQLPTEGKKFATVDKLWRQTLATAKGDVTAIEFCDNDKLLDRFRESSILLDQVQKGLSDYLETKRSVFARFYFLSNDELLSILSESKDVNLVQPHLKKCFEGIDKVKFHSKDQSIDRMISPEGEEILFNEKVQPSGKNVEVWMLELEAMMRVSIRSIMKAAIQDYTVTSRPNWMQKWPGMVVLNASQLHWTREMEELFITHGRLGPEVMFARQLSQLGDMIVLVRGELSKQARTTIGALTVIDVHARDVIQKLVDEKVDNKDNFNWNSQLRYYWVNSSSSPEGDMSVQMVAASRPYGYEYLGNTFRLVITPLTDKCYLTLMGALQMVFGGAPSGPAGTGKTETTKDLAKALAMQCVVFNCSDGLDYIAMGKFFKGLAACGAWACFDEFNRINIEVLSVIGQQIMSIQMAIRAKESRIFFEGSDISVSDRFAVFITMNPGYAGRSALPDSLQALFRPVAMMVPDYALIGEIMFFAYGFEHAKECGAKMVTTFKLCSEQLSAQPHYDYGMRAVKTVITAAGNLKQAEPEADEFVLLLRALQDVNIPKFLEMDLPLFEGIISDLFPGRKRPGLEYGALMSTMQEQIFKAGLLPSKFFVSKVVQLYEMIVVRHGLMLVGPTGGGKTSNLHTLQRTLTSLKEQNIQGFAYDRIKICELNPKSITMGQMYGEFDPNTLEWRDGIMSTMYRASSSDSSSDRTWLMFDGPVDAIWIESMNTVLDDNKKLCLNSGEIIKMSNTTTMMFEVEDLNVASPATVSRVGIIYMEPRGLGLDILFQSWLQRIPACIPQLVKNKLTYLFDTYLQPAITFLRTNLKELSPTVDNNLAQSLMRILDCYFDPFFPREDCPPPTEIQISNLGISIDALFIFALVWSVGITTNEEGRRMFDNFLQRELYANNFTWSYPNNSSVYDYVFDVNEKSWVKWVNIISPAELDPNKLHSFSEILIPTTDSIRTTYIMDLLLSQGKHVLLVGGTGTGKTCTIQQYLSGAPIHYGKSLPASIIPISLTFSATTSANMTQDVLDGKMDKRRKGVFGPANGKKFYLHIDDMNMPTREVYGAQPPIELIRQLLSQGGWYNRKDLTFRKIVDTIIIGSMGPAGGGRQEITGRLLRRFNLIGSIEMSDVSKQTIFQTILTTFFKTFEHSDISELQSICAPTTKASIELFNTILSGLLPTPAKSHYTFNLRDLAKVFQGLLMIDPKKPTTKAQFGRLWIHETTRVFVDRLTSNEDRQWVSNIIHNNALNIMNLPSDIVKQPTFLYGDFMNRNADHKVYEEITDISSLKGVVEEYLTSYNAETKQPMPLILFQDALSHVGRIARILRQPQGNALLLGVGGSGRQSMTRLASYITGYPVSTIEITKGYCYQDFREDIKKILLSAGIRDKPVTFLISDVQVIDERMVEDMNNILNSGDIPNLYLPEDYEAIANACRKECQKRKLQPTKLNIFTQYITRVRRNIHVCFAMSPIGDLFRTRLRNFPSLVNCSTIDWFTSWPAEALQSVGLSTLRTYRELLSISPEFENSTVEMFKHIHLSVEQSSIDFLASLRRYNYVTPTSYLELLSSFSKLLIEKRNDINTQHSRLQIGLDKLTETKSMVSSMQEELVLLQPQLVKTQEEVSAMMVEITADRQSAAITKQTVEVEEANASVKASEATAIAEDAQRDLAEAMPALEEAVRCLNDLKKADIDEVKSLRTPPDGVLLTIKVCCLIFNVPPIKKNDPANPGKKIEDYWEAGQKKLIYDAKVFLSSLLTFDKDNIPERTIKSIAPFMDDPKFTPAAIEFSSKACTAICMWARAMYKYHFVALGVAPKRARLAEAENDLALTMEQLSIAKATLASVNAKLRQLEHAYEEAVEKKDMLEKKEISCKKQLANAEKLIGGLGGEEVRWRQTVGQLSEASKNLLGDVIISAGTISYLGPFTSEYRNQLVVKWQKTMDALGIPHTSNCNIESTLSDPVQLRSWLASNLPNDSLSIQNALVMDHGRRWPLLIDPQGQANRYIRTMAKNLSTNGGTILDVIKLTDKNYLRVLETAIQLGRWVLLENVGETLDASLEPLLLQQKFKVGNQEMIRLGESTVPYNSSFRFFMTTKLSNPHYLPEVQVKVSLLNFTITHVGLVEQLLAVLVQEELPTLATQKSEIIVSNAAMNKQLYSIETEILYLLSNSTGNILDDTTLITTLATAKTTSEGIKAKMEESIGIEEEINKQSNNYLPVATRASLLYFVLSDLSLVDPMYQYSLQWFVGMFVRGINQAGKSSDISKRVILLNEYFTQAIYQNICRSLFEKHKLLFSFILTIKLLQGEGQVGKERSTPFSQEQYRFLLTGLVPTVASDSVSSPRVSMPHTTWLEENVWLEISSLATLQPFKQSKFLQDFVSNLRLWQEVFDSSDPHRVPLPLHLVEQPTPLEKLCVLRCLRRDKMELAMQDFIVTYLGESYIQPPLFDLKACYKDSSSMTPLVFILSAGSDPNKDLDILAEELGMTHRLKRIALGQGQGKKAAHMVEKGMASGDWVMLQNCHLSVSWMPILEQICETMDPEKVHPDFRLWLTSLPSDAFPSSILQSAIKITKEPPRGLRANLRSIFSKLDNEKLNGAWDGRTNAAMTKQKTKEFQKLLFGLSFFHAIVIERKKYGPLGWNIPYEFNDTDFDISAAQLQLYISEYETNIPYKVLQQLTSVVNYGGRITDDKDMRTSDILIADYLTPRAITDRYSFSTSGIYVNISPDADNPLGSYMKYIDGLPLNADPEVFGMHSNAAITTAIADVDNIFEIILALQPRQVSSAGGISRDEQIIQLAMSMQTSLPAPSDVEAVAMRYPTDYNESMNTVLVQELQRYNKLLEVMHSSLTSLQRALKGQVVLSADLEAMGTAMFDQRVPSNWSAVAYPSLKPLTPWYSDLITRLEFMTSWVDRGVPPVFWISGFFFPQGFLTAILQNYARKHTLPIDTISFSFLMVNETVEELQGGSRPADGSYIYGLYLEGARWNKRLASLVDPKPKELFSPMPVIHMLPASNRQPPTRGIYRCPVYKVLSRTGTLSTTGHSTNFVTWIEIPSDKETVYRNSLVSETNAQILFCDQDYWIKAGVACFCSLRY